MARECPHYDVRYRGQQNFNGQTGQPDFMPAGWYCAWCNQPFSPVPDGNLEPSELEKMYDK